MPKTTTIDAPEFTLAAILPLIQAAIEAPPLDGVNPHFKNRYTTLAAANETIIPVCTEHGVSVTQDVVTAIEGDVIYAAVSTILTGRNGERLVFGPLRVPAQSRTAQHLAGAVTYGRRISLLSTFCLAGEEDLDGEEQRPGNGSKPAAPAAKPAAVAPSKPAAQKPSGATTALQQVTVTDRREKEGVSEKGVPWRVVGYTFSDGTKASTFDANDQATLDDAGEAGLRVTLQITPGKKEGYFDIVKGSPVVLEASETESGDIPF